jgi:hypothetical protein
MLKGYRTIIFNVIMTGVMILKMWQPEAEVPGAEEIGGALDAIDAALVAAWGVGNMIFRAITNTAIGKPE